MDGDIKKETDDGFGLLVIDNNKVEHKIGVCYDGDIDGHIQDGYADDSARRTKEETEYGNQARRFAKWHVYRERGYDTLPPYENPDRVIAAIRTILDLTEVEARYHFGELQETLRRHHDDGEVDVPFAEADPDDTIVYRQDIWLQPDPVDAEPPLLDQFCEYVGNPAETLSGIFGNGPDPRDSFPDYEIEAVSDIHYLYNDGFSKQEHWNDQPREREPDARLELMPVDVDEFDSFQSFLASNLINQVRDCFVEMGVEPPEPFQVQGFGKHDAMVKQQLMDMYDQYFQASTPVNSWNPASK